MQPRFEILQQVHRSAFSTIERARDHATGQLIALKRPLAASDHWQREAAAFDHIPPHQRLIHRLEEGRDENAPFRCLPWIEGHSLDGHRFEAASAIQILNAVLSGLEAIHQAGYVHADLSPANVMLPTLAPAILIDFGSASPIKDATPNLVGSIHCMAPERFDKQPPSVASDLYSVGVIACYLLTAEFPFTGDTTAQIITAHHRQWRKPLSEQCRITPELSAWVDQMLARDPANRPASATHARCLLPP